ncbi:MAG: DUF5118 domain-containing protein, partial [Bacteroidota bacterium]
MINSTWKKYLLLSLMSAAILFTGSLEAQKPTPPAKKEAMEGEKKDGEDKKDEKKKEKTFKDFINDKAKTDEGMFNVHEVEGKYYFEIPENI